MIWIKRHSLLRLDAHIGIDVQLALSKNIAEQVQNTLCRTKLPPLRQHNSFEARRLNASTAPFHPGDSTLGCPVAHHPLPRLKQLISRPLPSRIAHDAEERQRFAERIIVVLLTVDAIEPLDKYLAIRRRRMFDVPDGHVKKEVANGVAQIVRMLDQDEKSTTSTSEV
ncbi:hypothetical protein CRG98_047941 [Punica granatum]|uniref:Uncharacterized protein n=1 Tax=Punica granatum TaxID=22663 RepID=A0A2I0HIX2_PUNGR|nr:hypothetical protein CRG98_047941 [Punica granatum]